MAAKRKVLLVEDDPLLLDALGIALQRRGYSVRSARDGFSALQLLKEQLPDIAILDMMLPGLSGFQITQQVKEQSDGRSFVLMMSGNSSEAHQDYAFSAGVDYFLPKPFGMSHFLEATESLCPPVPTARINGSGAALVSVALPA